MHALMGVADSYEQQGIGLTQKTENVNFFVKVGHSKLVL